MSEKLIVFSIKYRSIQDSYVHTNSESFKKLLIYFNHGNSKDFSQIFIILPIWILEITAANKLVGPVYQFCSIRIILPLFTSSHQPIWFIKHARLLFPVIFCSPICFPCFLPGVSYVQSSQALLLSWVTEPLFSAQWLCKSCFQNHFYICNKLNGWKSQTWGAHSQNWHCQDVFVCYYGWFGLFSCLLNLYRQSLK